MFSSQVSNQRFLTVDELIAKGFLPAQITPTPKRLFTVQLTNASQYTLPGDQPPACIHKFTQKLADRRD